MRRAEVPWFAALFTAFGLIWLVAIVGAYRSGEAASALVVFALPFVVFAVWFAVKAIMFWVFFPNG